METTVIELSKYTSNNGSNSDWTNVLCKPVKIDTNTYISVKQAFIDTRQINATTIQIPQDVKWTLYFMYYIINHGIGQTDRFGANLGATLIDGAPFVMARQPTIPSELPYLPVIDCVQIDIPAGLYDRTFFAEYITKKFQTLNQKPSTAQNINYTNANITPIWDASGEITGYSALPNPLPNNVVTSFLKSIIIKDQTSPALYIPYIVAGLGQTNVPVSFIPLCKDFATSAVAGDLIPGVGNKTIIYNDGNNNYYDGGLVGASQVALVYNDQNSSRYSFSYIHSPIVNNGDECTGVFCAPSGTANTGYLNYINWFNSFSGIMFCHTYTNLSADPNKITDANDNPFVDPFFEQLGMRYSDIVNPDMKSLKNIHPPTGNIVSYDFTYKRFLQYTTKNFNPVSGLVGSDTAPLNETSGTKYNIDTNSNKFYVSGYQFDTSSLTDEIYFSSVPISSNTNAGHYLIEINYGADEGYINKDKTMMIKGVIGSFYLSGDSFVQSMGPDSIVYNPHNGVPFVLNTLNVRILNPVTKQPETLGPNSTIYLQVSREIKDPIPEPPKTQPKNVSQK